MKRTAHPPLSYSGQEALACYECWLREREDLIAASIRNCLSELRHFIACYEAEREAQINDFFIPQGTNTPALTRYRTYMQTVQRQKPTSVNRSLINLKRYFRWARQNHIIAYYPSVAVNLVRQEESAPRHLDDQEKQALLAAVTKAGNLQDRVLIVLLLHTCLRAREVCRLQHDQVKLSKWSGCLEIVGKRDKYREMPLNATDRKVLEEYLPTLSPDGVFLFLSGKTREVLSERALGYIVKTDAFPARLQDVRHHDLRCRFGYGMMESLPMQGLGQIIGYMTHWTSPSFTSRNGEARFATSGRNDCVDLEAMNDISGLFRLTDGNAGLGVHRTKR